MKHTHEKDDFLKTFAQNNGYLHIKEIPGNRYVAIYSLMFTHAIIIGDIGDNYVFTDRWCYHSMYAAKKALEAWNGEGEPEGWHKNPRTGRNRDEDDNEYINYYGTEA